MVDISRSRVISGVGFVVIISAVVVFGVAAVPQVVGAEHSYVVLSDSMKPTFSAGSVVLVNEVPAAEISEGDVITYEASGGGAGMANVDRVTHRVVEVVNEDGERAFRTKGDANEEPDAQLVRSSSVIGVVIFSIPYIGYVTQFANSSNGLLLLVIVPTALLGLNEIWTLYQAATADEEQGTQN